MNSLGGAFVFLVGFVILGSAVAWPYENDDYSEWRLARSSRRSHHCIGSGSKCFSTTECCRGFVCAAFDDYFGQRGQRSEGGRNPEIPGFCVKEKDLQPCYSSRDCDPQAKCISLGRAGELYCVTRPEPAVQQLLDELPVISVPSANQLYEGEGKGGLGAKCADNSDCKSFEKAGGAQLCCQRVSRGRQGVRHLCDRVTAISKCIAG